MLSELKNKSYEELKEIFIKNMEESRVGHDVAVMMGEAGMGPQEYRKYKEVVDKIKEHKETW